jgi:Tfp pilus assembly protein PilN
MSHSPQPDFLRPVRRPHALAWAACATALLVLLTSGLDALQARQALTDAQDALRAAQAPPPRPPAPVDTPARKAVRQLRVDLDKPWEDALVSIESAVVPGVSWLALDINERGQLRLEGLASDTGAALAAADALRHQAAWSDVLMASVDKPSAGKLRFALTASPAQGNW